MKLLKLGKRLAPADQKVPLWLGQKLAATPEGFDLGVSGLGPVAFTRLQAVATCVTVIRGTPALVMLLAFEGLERPFVVEATAVAAPTFGVTPQPLPEGNVRQVVTQLVRKLPGVVIDDGTYEFLKGQAPRDVGRRIADLVQPIIRIVKDVAAQAPSAAVPASPSPPPATPSPPPATPSPPLAAPSPPPAAPSPPPATPSPPPAAPSPPPVATSSIPRAAPEPTVRGESPAVPPAPPPRAPAPPGPQPPQVRAHRSETLSPGASAARFVSQEGPCWYDDRKGSLVYMTANELFSARVRSRPKAEDILRYGQDPRVMKGVKATGVPFRRIERVVADDGLGRAEIRYLRGDAAKGGEKSKDLRIPFHSKTSGASLLRRLGEKLGPAWIRRKSQRGKGRVAIVMWKPLLSAVVPWLGLFFLFRSAPAPGCAIVVLAAGGVVVAAVLVRGVMRMVKAPAEVEELVPASAASAQ